MSKRYLAGASALVLLVAGGWVVAQPRPLGEPLTVQPAARYAVTGMGESAVLLDTASGKTWQLTKVGGESRWLPIDRVDDKDEAAKLREQAQQERNRGGVGQMRLEPFGGGMQFFGGGDAADMQKMMREANKQFEQMNRNLFRPQRNDELNGDLFGPLVKPGKKADGDKPAKGKGEEKE